MKIEGQLEKEDHVKAHRLNRRMASSEKWFVFLCFFMSLRPVVEAWFRKSEDLDVYGRFADIGSLVLVLVALSIVVERRWVPRKLRVQAESENPREIEINADGIITGTPDGKESVSWLRLHKYKIGNDMTLLYRYGGENLIFPDRWFTPLEKVEFERYLRKEIGEPAR